MAIAIVFFLFIYNELPTIVFAMLSSDDPNDAVSIAAVAEFVRLKALLCEPPIDSSTQKNGAILSFVLELIVSTVGVPPDSCGGGAPSSSLGLHLLLDTAACALFQHRSDDTSGAVRWSCLPLPLLEKALQAVASVDLVRSLSQGAGPLADKGHEVYFTSLRAASAAIVSSEPVVENVLQQEADRRAKRKELGKADALTTSAPLLRSVSSITRCILSSTLADAASGMDSSRTALLSVCKAYLPQYLTWLALPEHDVRRDVSQIIAQVCVGTFAGVGTASPPTADLNEISTLSRQLFHKLSCIPSMLAVSTTPATATAGTGSGSAPAGLSASGLSAAGALSVLGSIAVALLECAAVQVEGSSRAELRVEADRLVSQLLSQCIACLKLDPAISLEHCLVQVSALEGIIALSGCNFLSISEQARCAHWGEVKVNMKRLIHSTDFRCAVPAVEAFTNLCVAGASSGY